MGTPPLASPIASAPSGLPRIATFGSTWLWDSSITARRCPGTVCSPMASSTGSLPSTAAPNRRGRC
ncbi:hypothetical protein FH972_015049 [Carpinus fangiana]|uniref:Uncharacterized protein n=1 Tax=Carpinus fangiana TaxID=176857 RepID=A0A5N6RCL5_9ROSI|nr:hypothetical protein FH972_015049 [Carpinus fangiana]